jgi:hypothetical protein
MTPKERAVRAARNQEVDRIPAIGGWMNGVRNLANLAGIAVDEYFKNPAAAVVRANRNVGADLMITNPIVPQTLEEMRTGAVEEHKFEGIEPEALLDFANGLPDTEKEALKNVDPKVQEKLFRDCFEDAFRTWDGLVPLPNFWDLGGHFPLYHQFGYIAFLSACALYPEAVSKIWWVRSLGSRERAKILAKLYKEYDLVPLLFCGEDLCNNQGPMVAPEFLREHYFPHVKMIIEPLVESGVRVIHHCDCGFSGFQGFQYECDVSPFELRKLRSLRGEEPILFAGLSVSRTMPFGTKEEIHEEIEWLVDATDGGRGMFLHMSNVTGVEVPPDNIREAYGYVKTIKPGSRGTPRPRPWPWILKHPENA